MKEMLSFLCLFIALGLPGKVDAQNVNWREYIEQLAEEGMDEAAIENIYQEMLQLENCPLDLNSVTRDQLNQIPLLSLDEATAIADFLEKNRPVYTVFELRNVPYLDLKTVERIIPFFYAGENKSPETAALRSGILQYGHHEVQLRLDKTVTPRAGYSDFSDSILTRYPNRKYRGEDFYHSLRYAFRYRDKIQAGITAEKDAGEPFFKQGYPRGYDHYGLHLIVRDIGKLKTVALGDYRLSFGQGLILNNDFMVSKAWNSGSIVRRTQQPKRHFSTAESGFFRGAAVVAGMSNLTLTSFYSNKKIDTNLSDEGIITSFKTDGLHRTPLEIEKKENTREQVAGANINYRKNNIQAGISGVYHTYSRMYNPALQDYNIYYLRDKSNMNASIDYSYQLPGFIVAGETAVSKNGSVAALHTLQYRPSSNLSFSLLHRYYPISYNAL
ncbi:MAG: helix-hairpin-helix domain-containing protein, partial [Proteiniphilum sp.]|nr:helix-hairpin-helix domain-containing protein [Proteiniphilum sp.]